MADFVFVLVILAFFAVCAFYVLGCERLISRDGSTESIGDALPKEAVR